MPIKQFALLADLAYHVCVLEAEVEGQPHLPAGQEWLRTLALTEIGEWLGRSQDCRDIRDFSSDRQERRTPLC
jgi:hypothetical protein